MNEFLVSFRQLLESKLVQAYGNMFQVEYTKNYKSFDQLIVNHPECSGLVQVIARNDHIYVGGQSASFGEFEYFDIEPDGLANMICFRVNNEYQCHLDNAVWLLKY